MPSDCVHRVAGLACLALPLLAWAQTPVVSTAAPQNVVGLSTSAMREVTRDELSITFSTTREGADATQVQAQLKQALDAALVEARKAARPGAVDVQTGNFALYPRWSPKGGSSGWTGHAELVVSGRDIAAVSQLAGRIGTLTVARSSFALSHAARQAAEAEVTAQAIARFKERAELVARQFGFGGWTLREVQVQGGESHAAPQPMMRAQAVRAAGSEEALPVEAGQAQVMVTVSGTVQLSPR